MCLNIRVRISVLTEKIISGSLKPLKADPGGQPGTDRQFTLYVHALISKSQFLYQKII